ncbi:unnamed protein product [Prunus armeniaca]
MAEGPGDLVFGHEAEDDPALGISDDDYDGILGMIEEKTLASGGREVNKEAGMGNQRKPKEVSMNMVLVLPSEFSAPRGQTNGLDNDVAEEQLDQRPKTKEKLLVVAFNEVIPKDEPNKYRHLKPLYISAHVEGVPVFKVFVDCGATNNKSEREQAVHYLSRTLNMAELNYSPIEKLCLAFYFTATKLRHYMPPSVVQIISKTDLIKYMLTRPIIRGRIGKWTMALSEFTFQYVAQK